jgi:hypothetical protein
MPIKLLFLDTNAVVKLFTGEKGHDLMMWLFSTDTALIHSILLLTSTHVREEFPNTIKNMVAGNRLSAAEARGILQRSRGYLNHVTSRIHIVDVGDPPGFRLGHDTSADVLLKKYSRSQKDLTDMNQLAAVVNYLRNCVGGSLPHIVTSDRRFMSIIRRERFGVIDPEKMTIPMLQEHFGKLEQGE